MRSLFFTHPLDEEHGRSEPILLFVAALFVFSNALALGLGRDGRIDGSTLWGPLAWLVAQGTAVWLLRRYAPDHDPLLLPLVSLLSGWGIVLQDRLASNFLLLLVVWLVVGSAVLVGIAVLSRCLRCLRRVMS